MPGHCAPERENVEPQLDDENDREAVFKSMVDFGKRAFSKSWQLCRDKVEDEVQNNEESDPFLYRVAEVERAATCRNACATLLNKWL